jgi:hypothetical protein
VGFSIEALRAHIREELRQAWRVREVARVQDCLELGFGSVVARYFLHARQVRSRWLEYIINPLT